MKPIGAMRQSIAVWVLALSAAFAAGALAQKGDTAAGAAGTAAGTPVTDGTTGVDGAKLGCIPSLGTPSSTCDPQSPPHGF